MNATNPPAGAIFVHPDGRVVDGLPVAEDDFWKFPAIVPTDGRVHFSARIADVRAPLSEFLPSEEIIRHTGLTRLRRLAVRIRRLAMAIPTDTTNQTEATR